MTSQTGIMIGLSSDISRSKGNQAMKFDQLVEYDMKNIFLERNFS